MPFLKIHTNLLTSITLVLKWIINKLSNQTGPRNFHGCITFHFHILLFSTHVPQEILRDYIILIHDLKVYSCLMGLKIGKMLCAKPKVSVIDFSLCLKNAVTMLTQPVHIDEQLKKHLKSQKEENRNWLLDIIQSVSDLSCRGIAHHDQVRREVKFQAAPPLSCRQ